jgi:transcriptional regulator with XRE-family HTH domain
MMDRRDTLETFRQRLADAIGEAGVTRTEFADAVGIDRSTLSQLLSPANRRLPRVDTLTQIARWAQVSIDWLLGLTHEGPLRADLLHEQPTIEPASWSPDDERLVGWLHEARGYKVRYVPSTLPEPLKTETVIRFEAARYRQQPEQKIETAAARLEWQRRPETDMECCNSLQAVEGFAAGQGVWAGLDAAERRDQLDQMAALVDELYPTFRWFLYDGRARFAAPMTIFGMQRAALYIGHLYVVLHAADHVKALVANFDDLIRAAVVQPPDVAELLRHLRDA